MTRENYSKTAFDLLNSGKISPEVYDAMLMNADVFCDDEEEEA